MGEAELAGYVLAAAFTLHLLLRHLASRRLEKEKNSPSYRQSTPSASAPALFIPLLC